MTETSDFMVRVVRVFKVEKHPNADRLDILTVGEANPYPGVLVTVVRGSVSVGDKLVFVSPGALLPTSRPEWSFLAEKDSKTKASGYYRLRASNIRGVKSYGITCKIPEGFDWKVGKNVQNEMEILKYEDDPSSEENLKQARPVRRNWLSRFINNLFSERRHLAAPEYKVGNLRYESTSYFNQGEAVIITEKMHGTNVRFVKIGRKLFVGSHRTWKTDARTWLQKVFHTKGHHVRSFYGDDIYTETVERCIDVEQLEDSVVYYGEIVGTVASTGKHIQKGFTYGFSQTRLFLFPSAYNLKKKSWVLHSYDSFYQTSVETIDARTWGVTESGMPPLSYQELAEKDSSFLGTPDMVREGIVVHSMERPGVAAKYVSNRYRSI